MCCNYILEFRNTNSHLLQVYLGAWAKIVIVIKLKLLVIQTFYLQIRITTFKYGYKHECTCTFKFKRLITPLPSFLYNLQCLIMFWDLERTRYIILNKPVKDYNKVIIHIQKDPSKRICFTWYQQNYTIWNSVVVTGYTTMYKA